jgi:lathosterol oxidase
MFWSMANGYAPVLSWQEQSRVVCGAVSADAGLDFISFLLGPSLAALAALYRLAHALHHRNTMSGPWSGLLHASGRASAVFLSMC